MAVCKYHRDRPGVGVCMRCRAVICAACCTRLGGVNHCHVCLKILGRQRQRPQRSLALSALAAVLVLGLGGLLFFGLFLQVQGRLAP